MTIDEVAKPAAPIPSAEPAARSSVRVEPSVPAVATALACPVGASGAVPAALGLDRDRLTASGFEGAVGTTLTLPTGSGPVLVAVGIGDSAGADATGLRNAAAAFARAAASHAELAFSLEGLGPLEPATAAQAVVEGVLLARYRYDPLRSAPKGTAVSGLTLVAPPGDAAAVAQGAQRGQAFAWATQLARDLANTPHSHLNASMLADVATRLGASSRLEVEVFDEHDLAAMGCGGLLGVNAGSSQPPRMVKLVYRPRSDGAAGAPTPRVALVGKGLTYDSGGLSLKPGDEVHAQMKNDMSGAAAVLAAMAALDEVGCPNVVTGYLMCTDNMPSGTAMALGDVITIRGGTTVEVINTDAEGRLVMADALVLAAEEGHDAIVDIATLTGACMRALGTQVAGVLGNSEALVDQVRAAAERTDEPVWQLPLERRYRKELDSPVADLRNLGGANGGAITAALFLDHFVGGVPWAHVDIAGTAQASGEVPWQTAGCTGFGARLLLQLLVDFTPVAS